MPISKDPEKRKRQIENLKKGMAKKGQVLNPKGRPRATIRSMIDKFEKQGMIVPTAQEISKIYVYIASQTEEELVKTMKDKELPMMTRIIARGVLQKKGLDVVERIMDRAYGKEQRIDITTNGKDLKPEPLTIRFVANREELEKIRNEVPDIPADAGKEG
jgi:hypothetical protein